MKNFILPILLVVSLNTFSQIINVTPGASTQIIQTNTNITIGGGGGNKSYLVCQGVTLSYAESSTMDTILLEPGAVLKIDSTFSYGYSTIYAKAGSLVDINFRQVGKLIYETGVTILDTNLAMPSSFFMGSMLATSVQFNYSNLPGGVGCTAVATADLSTNDNKLTLFATQHQLILSGIFDAHAEITIFNSIGQAISKYQNIEDRTIIDISNLSNGLYWLQIQSNSKNTTVKSFVK